MAAFTIGIIQDHAGTDSQENVRRAEKLVRQAAGKGAQIICLKELFNSPYFCKAQKSDRFDLAEPIPGPTTDTMQKLARELEVVIVVPVFERQAAGVYRNSAAIIDADGSLMGVYRKMHIPDDPLFYEKYYFTPGEHDERTGSAGGFKVWKTRYATIGVLICWDQWYPTAIGWHPSEKKEWGQAQVDAWRTMQRAHAIANGVYVASPNRIGHEDEPGTDGITFFGHSFIADPFGRYIAEAGEQEEILIAKCDTALIEEVRRNWPFLRDRRVDAYAPILSRYLGQ
jgi:N-carbamoylputrescine amidase